VGGAQRTPINAASAVRVMMGFASLYPSYKKKPDTTIASGFQYFQ
jgi:hypothetical protein